MINIGFLNPGKMGIFLAASAQNSGQTSVWASEGRSGNTRGRAEEHQLTEVKSVAEMAERCEVIVSICPPHAADAVASDVIATGFKGTYLDANAISPELTRSIGEKISAAGVRYVDGGVVGGPVWDRRATRLYLSGPEAERMASFFKAGPIDPYVMGDEIGKASAMKMMYAARTKGTTALLCAIVAAADNLGVLDELKWQWNQDQDGLGDQILGRMQRVTAKAWRFAGEMEEIAATMASVDLPDGFHLGANEVYARMADFKDDPAWPDVDAAAVIKALQTPTHR